VPRKVPKYCERFRDRHGKLRLYFRKGKGPRIALPADVESDEFREVYANALLGPTKQKFNPLNSSSYAKQRRPDTVPASN
jgi:hypothetical protein